MASPSIKLWYFDFKGRAEGIRLLLSAAGKPFEDIRFKREEWPTYKKDAPFGQSPYVEIDGVKYGQSLAILQYFAREFGLYGKSNMEAFSIDQVLQLIQDLVPLAGKILHEADPAKKLEHVQNLKEKESPRVFGYIEKMLEKNGTGYLVGNELSMGDIAIFDLCNSAMKDALAPMTDYPLISAVVDKVKQQEGIKAYLASRPDTTL
ncbi:glutathione S-transferase 1 [Aplysia californica]|uniref:Glutathione S-transferase 1 n=1 Tax=Aplysia californica TaxID=6500 RepID=A0ABM1VY78_APLCA|nr:glutathione S-transferase 1 [Aplysia californica]